MRPFKLCALILFLLPSISPAALTFAPSVGLNKFDLAKQYLGTASGGDGSEPYRRVTVAMARKAIRDAADIGVTYFRVAATGFSPNAPGQPGDLDLWISEPAKYWDYMDTMMQDLDQAGIRVIFTFAWNQLQFPALVGETDRTMILNPRSSSALLLERYITEFIERYKARPTVLIYEISNELNLGADLDRVTRCANAGAPPRCQTIGNYSTEEMIAYLARVASLIRRLDRSRPISAGHSLPRPNAAFLRQFPEWTRPRPNKGPDTMEEMARNLIDISDAADVISVHLYPEAARRQFGLANGPDQRLLAALNRIAVNVEKPLFIGEFGDPDKKPGVAGSYANEVLNDIVALRVPLSALWVWEMYDRRTFSTGDSAPTRFSIDPSIDTGAVRALTSANHALSRAPSASKSENDRETRKRPRIVLTWPLACTYVDTSTVVHASAYDFSGTPKVRFLIDNRLVSEDESPPYSSPLELPSPAKGTHLLRVEAVGASGYVTAYETPVISRPGIQCALPSEHSHAR